MRAGGLLAGGGLLVVSWIAWFAASGPLTGPHTLRAAPAGESARAWRAPAASLPDGSAALGIPAIPIFAELRDGTPLAAFLADRSGSARSGTLSIAVFERPPAVVSLASASTCTAVAWSRAAALAPERFGDDPAYLARMALPPQGAWIALFVDGVLLDACRVGPERTLVRFELDAVTLHEALGLPLT